jgi:hypothetical protein
MPRDVAARTLPGDPAAALQAATKQYAERVKVSSDDSAAGYLKGKLVAGANITLTEKSGGGNETLEIAASAGLGVAWEASPVVGGVLKNNVSYVPPRCLSGRFVIQQPLKITKFTYDINAPGTYAMYVTSGPYDIVDGTPASEILFTVEDNVVVAAPGNVDFTPSSPMIFTPGEYWFSFVATGGCYWNICSHASAVWGALAPWPGIGCSLYYTDGAYYDGTLQWDESLMAIPLFITCYRGVWTA